MTGESITQSGLTASLEAGTGPEAIQNCNLGPAVVLRHRIVARQLRVAQGRLADRVCRLVASPMMANQEAGQFAW
jgi:hypothetical protein